MIPWAMGLPLVWDFTCVDTFAQSHLRQSSKEVGALAFEAESKKADKYSELARSHIVSPVCVETSGMFGPSASAFLADLGRRISLKSGDPREGLFLKQRLSLAVQRGNAQAFYGTFHQGSLDELYSFSHDEPHRLLPKDCG